MYISIHYFQATDKSLDVYRWALEGDQQLAEQYLQNLFVDVRYMNSKDEDPYAKVNKALANGLILRQCQWSHQVKSKRESKFKVNILAPDSRHVLLEDRGEVA